ncbi:hypothetical protein Tco_1055348 [Tanacetum coccineum]|uniref:Transposase n=1 Tax=Tanacetum coccineum TaxID=301880 RepID=A0ABQ5GZG1_9ASTR
MRLTVNFHHDGNFVPSPLMYQEGDESTIRDIKFEGMTFTRLSKMLQGTCMFPVKGYKNGKVIDVFLEHHGYDLSHWIQTDIDNNDDELSDVEMEDITGYGASDFVGENDVVIPNRSINDPFLNKLCNGSYINDFTDKSDGGESSQPSAKELEIDSDDEDVDKNFKLVNGVIYPEFDSKLPWNEMKPTLGLSLERVEVVVKKGKKGGWPYKKEKNEGELPKKDKGVLLRSPTKGKKCAYIRSPSKKGVQGQSSADKGKAEDLQGESVAKKGKKKGTKKGVNGCTFRLWASWMQDGSCFQIKTLIPEHTCSRNFELGSLVTFKWIAKQFALKIIEDPTITYRSIQEQIKKKYLINVSVGQCKRAKERALFDHEGGLIEHYNRLWDYRKQLLDTNPGSSVHLHVDELDNGKIHFKMIYVCFKAMIEGWSAGCMKVIGLDGCFLKGTCRGELLTAMGRDGNNQMFPIAWVVGLMEAVKNLLPYAEHRQCARHIYANFKKKWNGLHFKSLFWGAATSNVQHNFYTKMNLIGNIDPEAKQWLVDRNPNSWCRAFFKMDRGCAAYENGISESYHNSIRIARGKPLITMLEEIRVYLMQRLYSMHTLATNLVDIITPSIRKEIEHLKHSQRYWTVYPRGDNVFEVRNGDDSYGVNIENRTCACKCYFIKPVGGSSMWPQTPEEPPLPPVLRKMPAGPSVADPSSAGPSVADPSSAGPSVADSTGSGTQAATVTEDPIVADPTDEIPTQQSKTSDTAMIIEDAIATGRLKTAGLKRRCKSERIAKRAKAYQFGKDGAGSCSEKAWDVDEVLAEK